MSFARNQAQLIRLQSALSDSSTWLDRDELAEQININGALAGVFNPECATVQPYQLLLGLAEYLKANGVSIFTRARASVCQAGLLVNSFLVEAKHRIQATEAFGAPGREFIPLYSLMVATEPLPDRFWSEIGNQRRFTFAEYSHLVNYAQRTADSRLAIGGRGATYPFASRLVTGKESTLEVHEHIKSLARSWFPALADYEFTHAWGGAVAITRDWEPYVQWDERTGFGKLGGYAGDGVSMSYLAAKALAHLITSKSDNSRELHFVGRKIRRWEPEPLRYLAVNSLVKLSGVADREESRSNRPSLLNRIIAPLILR